MARYFIEEPAVTGLDGGRAVQVVFGPDDEALFGCCPVAIGSGLRMHVSSKNYSDSDTIAGRSSGADSHSHRRAHAQNPHSKSYPHTNTHPNTGSVPDSYSNSCS